VNYEGLASLQKWVDNKGYNLTKTNFKNNDPIPNPDLYDTLVILGGPMSINDDSKFPWFIKEKKSINRALNDGRKVVGICLGAQLLADVLGAKVTKAKHKEVGWFPIKLSEESKQVNHFTDFPDEFITFHWHGEEFSLPNNCTRIASSDACENQIFTYGDLAVGFQCHLEQTEYSISRMLDRAGDYLEPDKFVQNKDEILGNISYAIDNNKLLFKFLDSFIHGKVDTSN
jgi:GMP synthase-like glutamine amidotransferase